MAAERLFRVPRRAASIAAAAALCGTVACGGSDAEPAELEPGRTLELESEAALVTASVRAEGGHVETGRNAFLVEFDPVTTDLVAVQALMPAHGHGSLPPTIMRGEHGWRVGDVIFNMTGLWDVVLTVAVGGRDDAVQFSVDVK